MTVGELSVPFVSGQIVPMVTEGNMSCEEKKEKKKIGLVSLLYLV